MGCRDRAEGPESAPEYQQAAAALAELAYPTVIFPGGIGSYDREGRDDALRASPRILRALVEGGFLDAEAVVAIGAIGQAVRIDGAEASR